MRLFLLALLYYSSCVFAFRHSLRTRTRQHGLPPLHAGWSSAVSTADSLDDAVAEAVRAAAGGPTSTSDANVALFFVSSIYEASAFQYQSIFDALFAQLPSVTHIVGCTTGAVIGPLASTDEPVEVEARASISVMLAKIDNASVNVETLQMSTEQVSEYVKGESTLAESSSLVSSPSSIGGGTDDGKVLFLLATEATKSRLSEFVSALESKEGITAFGAVASSVTSLHTPKVFLSARRGPMQKLTSGVVGLYLCGDVEVTTITARSCLPIGPLFRVSSSTGREVLQLQEVVSQPGELQMEPQPPLVQLDRVLNMLPPSQAEALKRELLVGLLPKSTEQIRMDCVAAAEATGSAAAPLQDSMAASDDFFGQKPTAFDPLTGSITVPCLPPNSAFQFCMRDAPTARQDLAKAGAKLGAALAACSTPPDCVLLLGSMERGNRVFRLANWEARAVQAELLGADCCASVPVAGLYSAGTFGKITDARGERTLSALMETDALYAVLSRRSTRLPGVDAAASVLAVAAAAAAALRSDYCTPRELQSYGDRSDLVIVTKRDPESASPVKVASMDYVIPEKAPQPSNVLESLVWEREREVDRQRERFQLARALSLAKASQGKYRKRDFFDPILQAKAKASSSSATSASKPVVVEFARDSLYNGRLGGPEGSLYSPDEALGQVRRFGQEMRALLGAQGAEGAPLLGALGINVDFGTFRGSYEDVEELRRATDAGSAGEGSAGESPDLPIICSDFVVYAYQLFRAKSSGADAVKLMASVLSVQGSFAVESPVCSLL